MQARETFQSSSDAAAQVIHTAILKPGQQTQLCQASLAVEGEF